MANLYDKASLVLPVSPAYKDGVIQAYKPLTSEGTFDFSRGSNLAATRVNSDGLIEKGRENLLTYSNDFSQGVWVRNSLINIDFNGLDPLGGNTAMYAESSGNAYIYQDVTTTSGNLYTWSFYAKSTSPTDVSIRYDSTASNISLTTEWQRFQVYFIASSSTSRVWCGAGFSWGAGEVVHMAFPQVELGLVATDYIETTTTTAVSGITEDLPRLDYSGGASCPSLLLEPQRSNVASQSEYFGAWNTNGTASVTDNQSVSPEGVSNAALLDFGSTTSGANRIDLKPAISAGANYVFSVFVKNIDANRIGIRNYNTTKDAIANFDFSSGSFTHTNPNTIDTIVEPFSNGWYRIGIVFNSGVDTTADMRISPDTTSGSDGEQIYVYGAQLEAGSYPTSYIPTYGSSVTRSYEVYEKTSATSLIGQTQGVLFVDFVPNSESNTQWVVFLGSGNKYIGIYVGSSKVYLEVANVTSQAGFIAPTTIVKGQRYKCAIAYAENDFVAYVNGVQINTDSSGSVPATSTIRSYYNTTINGIKTNQLLVYKTRLSNEELATLTTI